MKIYVDADACPKPIKEVLYRAANRLKIETTFVANKALILPKSDYIKLKVVPHGLDVADQYIVDVVEAKDLVITADIPLAALVIEKKAHALEPRGDFFTENNIKQRLSIRNFMSDMRDMGHDTGGPSALHQRDVRSFANALDSFLATI